MDRTIKIWDTQGQDRTARDPPRSHRSGRPSGVRPARHVSPGSLQRGRLDQIWDGHASEEMRIAKSELSGTRGVWNGWPSAIGTQAGNASVGCDNLAGRVWDAALDLGPSRAKTFDLTGTTPRQLFGRGRLAPRGLLAGQRDKNR